MGETESPSKQGLYGQNAKVNKKDDDRGGLAEFTSSSLEIELVLKMFS